MAAENTRPGTNTRPGPTDWTPDPPKAPSDYAKRQTAIQSAADRQLIEKNTPESVRDLVSRPDYLTNPAVQAETERRLISEKTSVTAADDPEQARYEAIFKHSDWDAESRREAIAVARAANIDPDDLGDFVRAVKPDRAYTMEEAEAIMRRELGPAYEQKLEIAQRFLRERPALSSWLHRSGAGNQPAVFRAAVALAEKASGIQKQIDDLMGKGLPRDEARRLPYWDSSSPESRTVREKVATLHRRLWAGKVN